MIMVEVTWLYTFVRTHQIIHLKVMNLIVLSWISKKLFNRN